MIHRDIKPENILLLEGGRAVLADFGIARAVSAAGGENLTATGLVVGTPTYMSPEQATGEQDIDGRSDIYSLACVLYEMLAGQPPFVGASMDSIVRQHIAAEPPSITVIRPAVPKRVAATLNRALAKTPADRFSGVTLFVDALSRDDAATRRTPARLAWLGTRSGQGALIAIAAAAVAGAIVISRSGADVPPPATPVYQRTAIAVLPFANRSAEAAHAYFAGGLHDELQRRGVPTVSPGTRILHSTGSYTTERGDR